MRSKTWHVELHLDEDGDDTSARAVLHTELPEHLEGHGRARRAPQDPQVPQIGDELAAARALYALADALLRATRDIGTIDHRPAAPGLTGPTSVTARPRVPRSRPPRTGG
ncbi:MAG: dsRBD fold-containing protein [Actinomycetes bacterium]